MTTKTQKLDKTFDEEEDHKLFLFDNLMAMFLIQIHKGD